MKQYKTSEIDSYYHSPFEFWVFTNDGYSDIVIYCGKEIYELTTTEDPKEFCLNWTKQKIAELSEYFNE